MKSGTRAWQLPSAATVWFAAQVVMVGAVTSLTVRVAVQVELLPAASVAVRVIVFAPRTAAEPAAGDCVTVTVPGQLSVAVVPATKSGTTAAHVESTEMVWSAAQVIDGPLVSLTVIVTEHWAVLPAASVAVRVTTLAPSAAAEPATGD